jgi:drug/metabolite transporter (DMT)-like permease
MIFRLKALLPWFLLLFMGVAWGLSFSLARIAVSAGGMAFGITFWQNALCAAILLAYTCARRRPLPVSARHIRFYFVVALLGTSIPASCFYLAAEFVPAGVLSITVTLIPILTYAIALVMGKEDKSAIRMTGIACGTVAILLLVLPETSLPDRAAIPWVLLACVSSVCYALENIYLAQPGTHETGPVRTACGMNIVSAVIMAPVAIGTGQMFMPSLPLGALEWAVIGLAVITAGAYTAFIFVINIAGPLFASLCGYLITLAGVFWGIALFGETHSPWVWASLVVMLVGLALITPRTPDHGNEAGPDRENNDKLTTKP